MGSLDNGAAAAAGSYKRGPGPALRAGGVGGGSARKVRARSRLARFLLLEKVDYLQWMVAAAAFFFVAIVFVAFLPGSDVVVERPRLTLPSRRSGPGRVGGGGGGGTAEDRGGRVRWEAGVTFEFEPTRLREKWARERREEAKSLAELGTPVTRLGVRKPRLAMVSTTIEDCWRCVGGGYVWVGDLLFAMWFLILFSLLAVELSVGVW